MGGRVENRVAVITGGGSGIGRAIAGALVDEGAKVVVGDLDGDAAAAAAAELGADATAVMVDVTDPAQVEAMVAHGVDVFGSVDVAFAMAGINRPRPFLEIDEENFLGIIRVNAWGVYLTIREVARQMIDQGNGGKIICAASTVARRALPASTPYSASKAAVMSLVQAAAQDLAPHGITANAIAPGVVLTPMIERAVPEFAGLDPTGQTTNEDVFGALADGVLLQRPATTDEITPLAVFLAAAESSYITGQTIQVDGGTFLG